MEQSITLHGQDGTLEAGVFYAGSRAGAVIRGARHDEDELKELPVSAELWGDVDQDDFMSTMIPGVFMDQSIGARLFVDAILDDRPLSPTFHDGYKAQQMVDAALRSYEEKRWIAIDQVNAVIES
jgi:predicted dehydrogenase